MPVNVARPADEPLETAGALVQGATMPPTPPAIAAFVAWRGRRWTVALLLLAVATVLLRARYFGNPLVDADEEFYLLVGDRMLHGALPYVDIWDRKPLGLFLLFAAIRTLGGDGILQYQLVAAGFVAATTVVIAMLARRVSTPGAAIAAACCYPPALAMSGGMGGQTPVFYNLPVALAALVVAGLVVPERTAPSTRALLWRGAGAMLLLGLALQLKPTALFEGAFLGGALLWAGRRIGCGLPALAGAAALWVAAAVLPTALAWAGYAWIGHAPEFVYANFLSIFARGADGVGISAPLGNLLRVLLRISPFLVALAMGEWLLRPWAPWRHDAVAGPAHRFLLGWVATAAAGFLLFGTYFNHYALPLLPPLCVAAAPLFAVRFRGAGPVFAAVVLAAVLIPYPIEARKAERKRGDAAYARRLVAEIQPRLHGGCLFVFYGDPILYHLTGSCLPTRWPFPYHLSLAREAAALGVDPLAETHRILAARPPVIVDRLTDDDEVNLPVAALVHATLARDYRLVFAHKRPGRRPEYDRVWALRTAPGITPPGA